MSGNNKSINVNYSNIISYYSNLKRQFLNYYKQFAGKIDKDVQEQFTDQLVNELNIAGVDDVLNKANSLFDDLLSVITEKEKLKIFREKAKQLAKEKELAGDEILQQILPEILSEEELKRIVSDSLINQSPGFNNINILQHAQSYVKAVVQKRVIENKSHNPGRKKRTQIVKGYYKEAAIYTALTKIFDVVMEEPIVEIKDIGPKNTAIDTAIIFLNKNFNTTINQPIATTTIYGLQAKSWEKPWEKQQYNSNTGKENYYYSVGHRAQLLQSLKSEGKSHSWIGGVNFLAQLENAKIAIGALNALYVTGSGFNFTSDLITEMRQHNYYLAFVFNLDRYEATSTITWQLVQNHINMIKNKKNNT